MSKLKLKIKLSFISGLKNIVLTEISQYSNLRIINEDLDSIYLDFIKDFYRLKSLKSVLRAYVITQDPKFNPLYVSKHKAIIGNLITMISKDNKNQFKTFKIICAGSNSPEARSIADYIQETYRLSEDEDADLKIHIIKTSDIWEVGIQITPRPLSVRKYKVRNMEGAMNPTIAYAVNSLCQLAKAKTYLNIFSGSATLLIEAAQSYPNLKQLIGFDDNKENLSLAVQNIKKAGLMRKIKLKEANIFDKPNFGKFDVITSDLPFGMLISKYEDLEALYQCFFEYSEESLSHKGILAVYTHKHEILKRIISKSNFKVIKKIELKLVTSTRTYLYPKIFVCKLK